jgi:hypothetical protein
MRIAAAAAIWRRQVLRALLALAIAAAVAPAPASADAPSAPVATAYLAKLSHLPAGLRARIVDGYLRIWMAVPVRETVVVLDYRGVPYLRFSPAGVSVNERSEMYFLNQTPALTPPSLSRQTRIPLWRRVSRGHSYLWHDARLGALSTVALAPGQSYVGRWSIAIRVNGRLEAISGGLWHAPAPSIVWFWAIFAILACALAGWRVRSPQLDLRLARLLAVPALAGLALAAFAIQLHGRPTVPPSQDLELAVILAFSLWALIRVVGGRPGYLTYFAIAFLAFWEGIELVQSLLSAFVIVALPATITRVATVLCLGCGAALALVAFRLAGEPLRAGSRTSGSADEQDEREPLRRAYPGW